MDLTENNSNHPNLISSAQASECVIGSQTYNHSIIIPSDGKVTRCKIDSADDLTEKQIKKLCKYKPEVVILATGQSIVFPETEILHPLIKLHIGLEVLSNQAAARTFNVMLAEDRKVICLMLIQEHP